MTKLNEADMRAVSCYVDETLDSEQKALFERRLLQETQLREAVEQAREVRECFTVSREAKVPNIPADFGDRVAMRIQELPTRDALSFESSELGEIEAEEQGAVIFGKRLVAAAIMVLGLALATMTGIMPQADSGRLEAADQQQIDRLDQISKNWEAGATENRTRER